MKTSRCLISLAMVLMLGAPAMAQTDPPPAAPAAAAPAAAPTDPAAPVDPTAAAPEAAPAPEPSPEPAPEAAAPPPTPAPPPPPPAPPVEDEGTDEDEVVCAAGELCVGPVLSLGILNVIGIGAHARYGDYAGFGLDFQFIPTVGPEDGNVSTFLFTANGRFYPFGGAFFLGGGFAFQSVSIEAAIGGAKAAGSMSIPQLMLGLGFMGRDGFIMGIDLALGIPLGGTDVSVDSSRPTGAPADELASYDEAVTQLEDAADSFIKVLPVFPQINLLRIGYLF